MQYRMASIGVRWLDRPMLPLISGDQRRKHIAAIGLGRAGLGLLIEIALDFRERRIIVCFGPDCCLSEANVATFRCVDTSPPETSAAIARSKVDIGMNYAAALLDL